MPFFFPVGAYQQVKDVSDPASDWKRRLVAAYAHDIHALHARLGDATRATRQLVGPRGARRARRAGSTPARSTTRSATFASSARAFATRSTATLARFEVKSLISWRGEWYVVHLSAIK